MYNIHTGIKGKIIWSYGTVLKHFYFGTVLCSAMATRHKWLFNLKFIEMHWFSPSFTPAPFQVLSSHLTNTEYFYQCSAAPDCASECFLCTPVSFCYYRRNVVTLWFFYSLKFVVASSKYTNYQYVTVPFSFFLALTTCSTALLWSLN